MVQRCKQKNASKFNPKLICTNLFSFHLHCRLISISHRCQWCFVCIIRTFFKINTTKNEDKLSVLTYSQNHQYYPESYFVLNFNPLMETLKTLIVRKCLCWFSVHTIDFLWLFFLLHFLQSNDFCIFCALLIPHTLKYAAHLEDGGCYVCFL